MQRKEFLDLVRSPFPANEKSVEQVKEITEEFPYFQTAQLLYAKLLKEAHDIHYDSRLKIAAAYAADRKQLHHLIEKKFTDTIFESVYKIADHEQKTEPEKPAVDVSVFEKPQDIPAEINSVEETTSTPIDEKRIEPVVEEKQELNPVSEMEVPAPEIENIPAPDITVAFESEDKYKIEDFFAPEIIETEKSIVFKEIIPGIPSVIDELPEDEIKVAAVPVADPSVPEQPKGKQSFLQWLSYKTHGMAVENSAENNEAAVEQTAEEKKEAASLPSEEKPKPAPIEIIENFIKEEPRISPAKPGFFSPVNMARKSVEEHDDLVSPTLARIYLMQGNAQKAVSTYEKLILLYPEKSAFFAAQIEKILKGS